MRSYNFICLFLLLFFSSGSDADVAFRDDEISFSFPLTIGELSYLGRRDYDEERLGYSVRYEDNEAFKIDIFIYDNNVPNIGIRGVTENVKNEFVTIDNAIKYHEDKGNYLDVKLIEEGVIEFGHNKIEFLWSQHQSERDSHDSETKSRRS